MSEYSDTVARDFVVRDAPGAAGRNELVLKPRAPWIYVLGFGSWGVMISVPTTMFFVEGELPARGLPVAIGITFVGYALLWAAARAVINRGRLFVDGAEIVFERRPMWPFNTVRVRLADIRDVHIRMREPSFLHPATYRGFTMPQPYFVDFDVADGRSVRLPTTLGLNDTMAVVNFVKAQL